MNNRSNSGLARAAALTAERRKEISAQAAQARWELKATHKGNFKKEFGIDVSCYVLNDESKTAVISKRGMAITLGIEGEGGSKLMRFLGAEKMLPHVGPELTKKLSNPLVFKGLPSGPNGPSPIVHGYDVTLLIDVCKSIIVAHDAGALLERQKGTVKQAHVILNACAKLGIKGLVYALAGYNAEQMEIISAFKLYIRDEAKEHEREFPEDLYLEWYRLYGLSKPARNRPWKFKDLTLKHVYQPLANSDGKVLELTQAQRAASKKERRARLHQFLSDIGSKLLRRRLGQLLGIAQLSKDRAEYEANMVRIFGPQTALKLEENTENTKGAS